MPASEKIADKTLAPPEKALSYSATATFLPRNVASASFCSRATSCNASRNAGRVDSISLAYAAKLS